MSEEASAEPSVEPLTRFCSRGGESRNAARCLIDVQGRQCSADHQAEFS